MVGPGDLGVTYDFIGEGYAQPDAASASRRSGCSRATEGIVCDPVYSGKALAAVASRARAPARSCFWHTGGAQSVFTGRGWRRGLTR